jgi:hypothetical protein
MKLTVEISQEAYDWLKSGHGRPDGQIMNAEEAAAYIIEAEYKSWQIGPPPDFFDDDNKIPF